MANKKLEYTPPVIVKQKQMKFPVHIIEADGKRLVCKQCSSCHSCR